MKLINAESLHEKIEKLERRARKIMMRTPKGSEAYNFAEERVYTLEDVKIELGDEPIAYDVDAVVEEIRKKQRDALLVSANKDVNKDFYKGLEYGYEIAIDVVRNGGVK